MKTFNFIIDEIEKKFNSFDEMEKIYNDTRPQQNERNNIGAPLGKGYGGRVKSQSIRAKILRAQQTSLISRRKRGIGL